MTSLIDPTKPTTFVAYTADVRNNFQIAYNEITALQSLFGGGNVVMQVVTTSTNVTVGAAATYVAMRQAVPTAVQITLPANPATGRSVTIKDSLGVCFTHTFTVNTSDGTLIDLLSMYLLNNAFQVATFVFDGTGWGVGG